MFDKMVDLADRFGAIEAVRDALLTQPDTAAAKLAEVLNELAKTVKALDDELVSYLSLYFYSEESIALGRRVLLGMEVGESEIRINESRGHCHKIKNIYDKYLDKWFDKILNSKPDKRYSLATAFDGLTTSDDYIIEAMNETVAWLKDKAEKTLNEVELNNLAGANMLVQQARQEIKPVREKLIKTMSKLRELQADYIDVSGTV